MTNIESVLGGARKLAEANAKLNLLNELAHVVGLSTRQIKLANDTSNWTWFRTADTTEGA